VRVRAFAKINLSLRVLGMRRDGYHEVRTIFQSIALHDTLIFRRRRGPFRLTCDDPRLPLDRTNLIVRAAEAVWRASGRRGRAHDVTIDLAKRIPLEAGLVGGSSDAAAALRALGAMWCVDEARIRTIAATLGADVPYFLEGGTVLGLERGDLLFPLIDRPRAWVVLALPNFGVSTRKAYEWFDSDVVGRDHVGADLRVRPKRLVGRSQRRLRGADTWVGPYNLINDVQNPVAKRHPEISRIVAALFRAGAWHAAMTGSGSAVFGVFDSRDAALRAPSRLPQTLSGRILLSRTVARAEYQRLAAK